MRIGLFSDTYLPDINGVAVSVATLKNELEKHGHEVLVVTSEMPKDSDYQDTGSNILRLPGIQIKKIYGYRLSNMYSFKGMSEIRKANLDVIHVHTEFGIGAFGKLAAEILDLPVVYTYHTMYEDYTHYLGASHGSRMESILKKVFNSFSKFCGDLCTELIVPTKKTRDALARYGITKDMHIIATGLELDRFDMKNFNSKRNEEVKQECGITDQFVLTYLGRVAKEKDISLVLEGVKKAITQGVNIRFLIVGAGPSLDELKQEANDLDIADYVCFVGKKDTSDVPNYYHASHAFVSASLSETQGLTFIEAMASSLPVLARHDESIADVIKDGSNGYFFTDADDLANKIVKMSKDDLSIMANQAYQDSRQYSSEVFYEAVYKVYKDSIQHKHYDYKITSVFPIGNQSYECSFKHGNHEITLLLPQKTVEGFNLSKGKTIDRITLDELKAFEGSFNAVRKGLKLLALKDYTEAEMRKKLSKNSEFNDFHIEHAIDFLKEKNLINDKDYAFSYLKRTTTYHFGFLKAINTLKKKGISEDIIELCKEEYSAEADIETAIEMVSNIYKNNKTKSMNQLVHAIRDRLFYHGFTVDVIDKALNQFDFYSEVNREKEILEKEYNKALRKFEKKYEDRELRNRVITYLLRKGFDYEDIKKLGIEREESDQYDD